MHNFKQDNNFLVFAVSIISGIHQGRNEVMLKIETALAALTKAVTVVNSAAADIDVTTVTRAEAAATNPPNATSVVATVAAPKTN